MYIHLQPLQPLRLKPWIFFHFKSTKTSNPKRSWNKNACVFLPEPWRESWKVNFRREQALLISKKKRLHNARDPRGRQGCPVNAQVLGPLKMLKNSHQKSCLIENPPRTNLLKITLRKGWLVAMTSSSLVVSSKCQVDFFKKLPATKKTYATWIPWVLRIPSISEWLGAASPPDSKYLSCRLTDQGCVWPKVSPSFQENTFGRNPAINHHRLDGAKLPWFCAWDNHG